MVVVEFLVFCGSVYGCIYGCIMLYFLIGDSVVWMCIYMYYGINTLGNMIV